MIRCKNVHVTFNRSLPTEKKALLGVNLKVEDGEFVSIIGSNGAGKSTLLNTIGGDFRVNSGKIYFSDKDVTKLSQHARSPYVARVFQDPLAGSCGNLTIEENMAIAWGRGSSGNMRLALNNKLKRIFREKLNLLGLGLENRLDTQMQLLSGGQRQSVSLLMATMRPSSILLLDEHTAALDPKTAELILDITNKIITESNLTTLMVTHSMRQALTYGTRTIMLHAGKVVFDIKGSERKKMEIKDLLELFSKAKGEQLDDDKLLLS